MVMNIIEEVRNFVENECKKPTSKYGYEPFPHHFVPTVKYAEKLAERIPCDKEIVIIAAWLHDIGSIMRGRNDHHVTGAKIAEEKLKELGYPEDRIKQVVKCIFNHRGSIGKDTESVEEQILIEADTMSAFDNISGIFKAAFIYEDLNQGEAKEAARAKLQNKWNQLKSNHSKEIIRERYEAAMIILR